MTEMRLCAVTEALCHSAHPWTDETHDRLALFTCFDTVNQKWGTERTPPEVVMSMAPKRRSLFRAVNAVNKEYDPEFPASQCERSAARQAPLPLPPSDPGWACADGDGGAGAFGDVVRIPLASSQPQRV